MEIFDRERGRGANLHAHAFGVAEDKTPAGRSDKASAFRETGAFRKAWAFRKAGAFRETGGAFREACAFYKAGAPRKAGAFFKTGTFRKACATENGEVGGG